MKLTNKFFKTFFFKTILLLASGTFLAQVIQIISYPFVARFFTPEDFGLKAFFSTILILIVSFSTGKYEEAIPIPKSDKEAVHILTLSILLSLFIALITAMFFLFFRHLFFNKQSNYDFIIFIILLPFGVVFISIINTLIQWSMRKGEYQTMAKVRIIQSTAKAIFETGGGYFGFGGVVLIFGILIGLFGGVVTYISYFFSQVRSLEIELKQSLEKETLQRTLKRFINFPKYSVAADLFNRLNGQLLILYFSFYSTLDVVGHFSIVILVITIPNVIFIESFLRVFYSQLASKLKTRTNDNFYFFFKNVILVTAVSIVIALVFFLIGKSFILFTFGTQWKLAGDILPNYCWILISFGWINISYYIFVLLERQKIFLILNLLKLIFLLVGIFFGHYLSFSLIGIINIYVLILFGFSIIQLIVSFKFLRTN